MDRTVWKFELPGPCDQFELQMPEDSEILCVQLQNGKPCLWALVHPEKPKTDRHFQWVGTGHPLCDEASKYIATWQELGGALIWHLFECFH